MSTVWNLQRLNVTRLRVINTAQKVGRVPTVPPVTSQCATIMGTVSQITADTPSVSVITAGQDNTVKTESTGVNQTRVNMAEHATIQTVHSPVNAQMGGMDTHVLYLTDVNSISHVQMVEHV